MNNKLSVFGSAFKYGQTKDGVQLAPSVLSKMGLSKKLSNLGNKVKHFGSLYPKDKDNNLRTVGLLSLTWGQTEQSFVGSTIRLN